jgi:hypothetical protein
MKATHTTFVWRTRTAMEAGKNFTRIISIIGWTKHNANVNTAGNKFSPLQC